MSLIVDLRPDLYRCRRSAGRVCGVVHSTPWKWGSRHEQDMDGHPCGESCWSTRLWDPVATNVRSF
jgi:hypothetical protein